MVEDWGVSFIFILNTLNASSEIMSHSLDFGRPHPAVAEVAGISLLFSLLFSLAFLQYTHDRMREYFFKKLCWEMEMLGLSSLITSTSTMGSGDHLKSAVS